MKYAPLVNTRAYQNIRKDGKSNRLWEASPSWVDIPPCCHVGIRSDQRDKRRRSRDLLFQNRLDVLYRATPAIFGDVEDNAFGGAVFYLVEDVRIGLFAPGQIAA